MRRLDPLQVSSERQVTQADLALKAAQSDMVSVQAAVTAGAGAIAALQSTQASQADAISAKLDDAPSDGHTYARKNGAWVQIA